MLWNKFNYIHLFHYINEPFSFGWSSKLSHLAHVFLSATSKFHVLSCKPHCYYGLDPTNCEQKESMKQISPFPLLYHPKMLLQKYIMNVDSPRAVLLPQDERLCWKRAASSSPVATGRSLVVTTGKYLGGALAACSVVGRHQLEWTWKVQVSFGSGPLPS